MGVRDFLDRLRPSGTPGAPSVAGVPADRIAERATELQGVFALLAEAQAEVGRIDAEAQQYADARRAEASTRAAAMVARARRLAEAERSAAAAAAQSSAADEARAILADAQANAADIAVRARARRPDLVATALEQARCELLAVPADAP